MSANWRTTLSDDESRELFRLEVTLSVFEAKCKELRLNRRKLMVRGFERYKRLRQIEERSDTASKLVDPPA